MQSPYSFIPDISQSLYESHLNILTNNDGGMHPFGRLRNLDYQEQGCFEVNIFTDETNLPFEKTVDDVLNLNKYTCHICNIEVPKSYTKEHNNSAKHKTCNDIANLALERTKLQMQLDIAVSRKVEISDTYFCEPCSAVVQNSNRNKHETTKMHKISLKHDEMLNDLLQIYTDIDNVDLKSEADELELLQQRIELESLQESESCTTVGLCTESIESETEMVDLKSMREEVNAIKTEFKSALNSELKTVADEVSEFREIVDKMKQETAMLQERSDALFVKVDEFEYNHLETSNKAMPAKTARTTRETLSKKYHIKKLKERFQNKTAPVAVEEVKKTKNVVPPKEVDQSSAVVVRENRNSEPLDAISKKIDTIMAKYFDNNCTVDALNNTNRKHTKNSNKKREGKEQNNIENKDQIQNNENKEQTQKKKCKEQTENEDSTEQNKDIQQDEDTYKHHSESSVTEEKNNNINAEQNKNKYQTEENIEHINNTNLNKNNDIENTQENKKPDQTKEREQIKDTKKTKQTKLKEIKEQKITKPAKSQAPSFNLVYYLRDITRRCKTKPVHSVEALTDTIVQITAINGDKFKVLLNNFHSFHVKAQETYCKVCESPGVRRPEWHIIENEHRDKVMVPIKDRDGIRQLDDIWSHCILCNDLTKNVDFHLQSLLHRNKLKHCLVELGQNDKDNEEGNVIHEEKLPATSTNGAITELMSKHNLAMTSKNYLNCVICDVIVNYNTTSVQQHVNSFDHLNNFEREQNENNLVDVDTDKFYCIGCDVNFEKSLMFNHCNGRKHKKLLQEVNKQSHELVATQTNDNEIVLSSISQSVKNPSKDSIKDSELICFMCNIIIYCIDEHMDSFEHKKSYYSYLEANKLNEIEADTFYCIPCNTVITIDYLMSHCTSRKHRLILKNFQASRQTNITTENEQTERKSMENIKNTLQSERDKLNQNHRSPTPQTNIAIDKTMPLKVLYQFREMIDSRKLLCTVCDEEIMYNKKNALYHVSTLDHVVAFNLLMLWNKIKKRPDKYYCDICRSDMTYFSEITHILGKQHVSNLAKEPKGTVYEYDRTLVTHAYAMSHTVGDRKRPSSIVSVKPVKN